MIIIDGHNLLWASQKVTEESEAISDVGMCRLIGRYLKAVDEKCQVVFDGIGPPDKTGFDNIVNLEVIFSGLKRDADSIIEDKIRADTAPKRLTVVSSDRRIRAAARARKATAVKSEVFWKEVHKELGRKKSHKEPSQKRRGLSDSETKQWLEIFGIEQ